MQHNRLTAHPSLILYTAFARSATTSLCLTFVDEFEEGGDGEHVFAQVAFLPFLAIVVDGIDDDDAGDDGRDGDERRKGLVVEGAAAEEVVGEVVEEAVVLLIGPLLAQHDHGASEAAVAVSAVAVSAVAVPTVSVTRRAGDTSDTAEASQSCSQTAAAAAQTEAAASQPV